MSDIEILSVLLNNNGNQQVVEVGPSWQVPAEDIKIRQFG
jgi:uncharacterized protein YegJ (DUF2314 family)